VRYVVSDAEDFLQDPQVFVARHRRGQDSLILVGGSEAGTVQAIAAAADRHALIYLATAPGPAAAFAGGQGTSFACAGISEELARAVIIHGVEGEGRRCALVASDSPAARPISGLARRLLSARGHSIVAEIGAPVGTRDFGAILASVAAAAAQINVVAMGGLDLTVLRQQVQDLGLDRAATWLFLCQSGCDHGPAGADNGFGTYAASWHRNLPTMAAGAQAFACRFRELWPDGPDPDETAHAAYTALRDLLQMIERGGPASIGNRARALATQAAASRERTQIEDPGVDPSVRVLRRETYIISSSGRGPPSISVSARSGAPGLA
jgi:ABC-type branched-subunit amino acid transport system substrate-binding protein